MKPAVCAALLAFLFTLQVPAKQPIPPATVPPKTQQIHLNGHVFTLPTGFTIELVAGPPLIERPILADFDDEGRLYVAEASGTNEPVQQQLAKKPHRIVRLEDTNGDGVFDKRTEFADKMMFPEGVLFHEGSVYVAAPPSIWKLTDTDGDGKADQRVEWFQGKTLTGCANDLHGPYLGPDGWLYWCKGAFAQQTYERPGQPPFKTRAAHIFRARPDGTGIEPVMTGGMDNPVEVVFTPGGERIFTTTFLQHPAGGKRDGLIHAVYGGVYGKDHDPIYEHPWTGPTLMPVMTHLGAAAPSGLIRYESDIFGKEYQDNLFTTCFNLRKVTRHVLIPHGSTFRTRDEDFLVSNNLDFHPTDVLEDADGSLLVIDTGGWYKLCCPTSQLHKPDVPGAIYRIRKVGARKIDDPRGKGIEWEKLSIKQLMVLACYADEIPLRKKAKRILAHHGEAGFEWLDRPLARDSSARTARNAVWVATQIPGKVARAAVRSGLSHPDESVRQAALHSIALWRDAEAVPQLRQMLQSPSLHNRRAAAEALGRIGKKDAVPDLIDAAGSQANDRVLTHSLIYALIEIGDLTTTKHGLTHPNAKSREAAFIALSQMQGGLQPADMIQQYANDPPLREIVWWIIGRRPEWGDALAGFLKERFRNPGEHGELLKHLPALARSTAIQKLLVDISHDSTEVQLLVLRIMAQAKLKGVPSPWLNRVRELLGEAEGDPLRQTVAMVRAWPLKKEQADALTPLLIWIGDDGSQPLLLRLQALAAVRGGLREVDVELFAWLCRQLHSEQPPAHRSLAVEVVSQARLTSEQLVRLTGRLKDLGPMDLDRVLNAFAQTKDEAVGLKLIQALKTVPAPTALRIDTLRTALAKQGPRVHKEAEGLYAQVAADTAKQKEHLEQLLKTLPSGDVRRGQSVFHSPKAACVSCHAIGYQGGTVGPDLTHIGRIRAERDLLEAIVFPNASFVRSYEPVLVLTKEGKLHNGILRRDTPEEIVLALSADQEIRLAREEIEEMRPGKVSVMPSGLEQQLTPQELADVVAFLRACQ